MRKILDYKAFGADCRYNPLELLLLHKPFSILKRFSEHPVTAACSGVSGLTSVLVLVSKIPIPYVATPAVLWPVPMVLTTLCIFGVVAITRRATQMKRVAEDLHGINHLYRDRVGAICAGVASQEDEEEDVDPNNLTDEQLEEEYRAIEAFGLRLLDEERETLHLVCQKVSKIFSTLTERDCVTSVRLLSNDETQLKLYTRSENQSRRDQLGPDHDVLSFGRGINNGFDKAASRNDGRVSHFLSGDLVAAQSRGEYTNQRSNFSEFYKSILIVPIRFCGETDELVGFLYVDSMSRNRLNNEEHLQLLASIADQMYNYIRLMRVQFMPIEVYESLESA